MALTHAVILAGGKGTRLKKFLNGLPKPLVPVNNKPLLLYQIESLIKFGINKISILVNYESIKIKKFILECDFKNISIEILEDGKSPLGTAGSIIKHLKLFEKTFLLVYGDTYLNVDIKQMYLSHSKNDLTVFAHPNSHPYDSDILICENQNLTGISPYPHKKNFYSANLVAAALYIIERDALINIVNQFDLNGIKLDFAKDIINFYLKSKKNILVYKSKEYIKDCGTPDRLKSVENDIKNKIPESLSKDKRLNAVFIDRDGTLIEEVGHLNSINEIKLLSDVSKGLQILNKNGFFTSIVTNQPVVARGDLSINLLNKIHDKLEWELGKLGVFFDELEYCPHHPDRGFSGEVKHLKFDCNCRKPKTGMLSKLVKNNKINLSNSWFIGDTTTDILCGQNFSLKTILVKTGYGGYDNKYYVQPDFIFNNLHESAKFINSGYRKIYNNLNKIKLELNSKNIFISGLSNSGKTTFSNVLKYYIVENTNKNCFVIHQDDYLKDLDQRKVFPDIFNDNEINNLISRRAKNKVLNISARKYCKKNRKVVKYPNNNLKIQPDDFLIFEGLTIVNYACNFFNTNLFYLNNDEQIIYKRFKSDYLSRGLTIKNIEKLYNDRLLERKKIKLIKSKNNIINVNIKNTI